MELLRLSHSARKVALVVLYLLTVVSSTGQVLDSVDNALERNNVHVLACRLRVPCSVAATDLVAP